MIALPFIIFLWRMAQNVIAFLLRDFVPYNYGFSLESVFGPKLPYWVWQWGNMDGIRFHHLSLFGYRAEEVPFFPLWPMFLRWSRFIFLNESVISGIVMTFLLLVVSLYLFKILLDEKQSLWPLMVAVVLAFPTSFTLVSLYNDALFLFLATLTLVTVQKKYWLTAFIVAFLAGLTRLSGLALAPLLFLGFWEAQGLSWWRLSDWKKILTLPKRIFPSIMLGIAPLLGLIAYLAWIHLQFGDWQLFYKGVEVWHRSHLVFPLQTLWRYGKILIANFGWSAGYLVSVLELAFFSLYAVTLWFGWKKIKLSEWMMVFTALLIPISTGTLQGFPRYGLHLYPLWYLWTVWLHKRHWLIKFIVFAFSIGLQIIYVLWFTRGQFGT